MMARPRESQGPLFQRQLQRLKHIWREHEEVRVGTFAAGVAFFFTHGLPLWNDDYTQWIAQANTGLFEVIKRVLLPMTGDAATWGYSDRPVQVLVYWVLHFVFGFWGTGYFFVKSAVFGALCGTLHHWMRRAGVDKAAAVCALALFTLSANVQASMIWLSDFGVFAQLVLAGILFHSVQRISEGPAGIEVFRSGWAGVPRDFKRFVAIFFAAVYFGSKIRGDVRLAPIVLLVWLAITDREKLKVYAAPFAVTLLATLPWSTALFSQLPPFIPGAEGYQGWTFNAFSFGRVYEFLMSDMFTLQGPPLSVLGAVGVLFSVAAIAYGFYRLYEERLEAPDSGTLLILVWLACAALASGTLARQNATFQLRYTLILLVPAVLLCGRILQAAAHDFRRLAWFSPVVLVIVILQCGFHLYHASQHRRAVGSTMVAIDKAYRMIESDHQNSQLVLFPGFLNYGFKPETAPSLKKRKGLNDVNEISGYPTGNTVALSWDATLDSRFSMQALADGCTYSLFDLFYPCRQGVGTKVLKYVGQPNELAEADRLNRQGKTQAARDVLSRYLEREPGNHGAAFTLSLFAYHLKDFAGMEKVYDSMGHYFGTHPSVLYNWALAKQGAGKLGEAAELLEQVYAMVPQDQSYGVGFNLADVYYRQGEKRRALATLSDLMQRYPNDEKMKSVYTEWSK